jgi:hypothetical protein
MQRRICVYRSNEARETRSDLVKRVTQSGIPQAILGSTGTAASQSCRAGAAAARDHQTIPKRLSPADHERRISAAHDVSNAARSVQFPACQKPSIIIPLASTLHNRRRRCGLAGDWKFWIPSISTITSRQQACEVKAKQQWPPNNH